MHEKGGSFDRVRKMLSSLLVGTRCSGECALPEQLLWERRHVISIVKYVVWRGCKLAKRIEASQAGAVVGGQPVPLWDPCHRRGRGPLGRWSICTLQPLACCWYVLNNGG
jgi:hypothetical protein